MTHVGGCPVKIAALATTFALCFLPIHRGLAYMDNVYWLRIHGRYGLERVDPQGGHAEGDGPFILVVREGIYSPSDTVMTRVREYAVSGDAIFGKRRDTWFIFNAEETDADAEAPEPEMFANEADWRRALDALGVPADIPLLHPDDIAATRPHRELFPYAYILFRGFLGLSDLGWGNVFSVAALVVSFALGLTKMGRYRLGISAIGLGTLAGLVLAFIGTERSSCALIGAGLLCWGAGAVGRGVRKAVLAIRGRPPNESFENVQL